MASSVITNEEIAKILREIGEYLEMEGEAFKPRAYEKAAEAVEALAEEVREIYKKGSLKLPAERSKKNKIIDKTPERTKTPLNEIVLLRKNPPTIIKNKNKEIALKIGKIDLSVVYFPQKLITLRYSILVLAISPSVEIYSISPPRFCIGVI